MALQKRRPTPLSLLRFCSSQIEMRTEIDPRPDPPPSLSSRGTFPDADAATDEKVPGVKISCMAQPLAFMVTKEREAYLKDRP